MRGEFKNIEYGASKNYDMSRGLFFEDNDVYLLEAYDSDQQKGVAVKLYNQDESYTTTVVNHPGLHGAGVNESLSLSSAEAELPETDEGIEAYARYVLQSGGKEESLSYEGSRFLDDIF